ncbi:MAG: hypothetical protein GC182_08555 [Rhodopseudomonas sp.]|nr:hypothetical protein [Rhodopseudomonas sp.]
MSTLFEDLAGLASAAVDSVYGETFTLLPMTAAGDVNDLVAADQVRASLPFIGNFLDAYARVDSGAARTQGVKAERPGHASNRPQLSFDRAALPYAVRRGDRVLRAKDGVTYHLAEPRSPDLVRVIVDLNRT